MFSGRLHPSEIAGKLAREADLARFEHETGPATANRYLILLNPQNLTVATAELEALLAEGVSQHAAEEGLRLEGPVTVDVTISEEVAPGDVVSRVEVRPGDPVPWARLVTETETLEVGRNRCLVGRSDTADIRLAYEDVSRRHALLWRESGRIWIEDLGSSNGTTVDGRPVTSAPRQVRHGSTIAFSSHPYRLLEP